MRHLIWILSVGVFLAPTATRAGDFCGTGQLGASGMWHLATAALCDAQILNINMGGGYDTLSGLTNAQDTYRQNTYTLGLTWTIVPAWQVGLAFRSSHSALTTPGKQMTRGADAVTLFAKYSVALWNTLEGGVVVQTSTPHAAPSGEASRADQLSILSVPLVPKASTVTPQLLLTWRPALLEAGLSLGYAFDNSGAQVAQPVSVEQATGLDIAAGDRVLLQAGLQKRFATAFDWLALAPFFELGAALPGESAVKQTAAAITLGGKAMLGPRAIVEATLGVDVGLAGLPPSAATAPTTPPWQVFLQASINLEALLLAARPEVKPVVCPAVASAVSPAPPPPPPPPKIVYIADPNIVYLTLSGRVVDANTGADLPGARVTVKGFNTILTTEGHTGTFEMWPVDVRSEPWVFTASAPGYLDASITIDVRTWPPQTPMRIEMQPDATATAPLSLRGIVRDDRTGEPLAAQIFISASSTLVTCGQDGAFTTPLKPGRVEVIVSAPEHASQKHIVEGGPGETVILNVDMLHEAPRKAGASE